MRDVERHPSGARHLPTEMGRPVVALLEARMKSELARLVEKHGGRPMCIPAVGEAPHRAGEVVERFMTELRNERRNDIVVFMTGVAVSLLFESAEQLGRRSELVSALRNVTTVCRGPKPTAALRGFGVPPTVSAREPFTAAEVIDALSDFELTGRRVFLFNYGERSETLVETMLARQVQLNEFWLYRWVMPADGGVGLEALVHDVVEGRVDALALTCQIQFRHLYRVAERIELADQLIEALKNHVVVGAVGPTCRAILEAYGVNPDVIPDHPKMGPLIVALMRHLELSKHRSTDNHEWRKGNEQQKPALD
jgi:uroporphyrinogen-III synthase